MLFQFTPTEVFTSSFRFLSAGQCIVSESIGVVHTQSDVANKDIEDF